MDRGRHDCLRDRPIGNRTPAHLSGWRRAGGDHEAQPAARRVRSPLSRTAAAPLAVDSNDQQMDIWIWDLARETLRRLTFDQARDNYPAWMPDGRRVVFSSAGALYLQAADGTGVAERLPAVPGGSAAPTVSPDGSRVVFHDPAGNLSLFTLGNERSVRALIQGTFDKRNPEISPDGRRFLMIKEATSGGETSPPPQLVVVQNWFEELKRLAPTK